jgi:hypothetical protein
MRHIPVRQRVTKKNRKKQGGSHLFFPTQNPKSKIGTFAFQTLSFVVKWIPAFAEMITEKLLIRVIRIIRVIRDPRSFFFWSLLKKG